MPTSPKLFKKPKVVILAGGLGSRLSEETSLKPKPMVEIGLYPILWHIMKSYSAHGLNEFIICLGYKGYKIKEYFLNYHLMQSDVTFHLATGTTTSVHQTQAEDWSVTLVDTGETTMTGGRLKRVREYLGEDDYFCMTYGDGVGDVNITDSIRFHQAHGKLATVTVVRPLARFGSVEMDGDQVTHFVEKPVTESGLINGGFFVLSPQVLDYIPGDATLWERDPLENLASDGQLMAYQHKGFWQPMDTLRDKQHLEQLWDSGHAPWAVWQKPALVGTV